MVGKLLDRWPIWALVLSALILGAAYAFQYVGQLQPCELCLKEREVWWVALAISLVGIVAMALPKTPMSRRGAKVALAVTLLFGAGLAAYHAGVEWKWWPGPASCTGGTTNLSIAELEQSLNRVAIPSCDAPAWVFLGLSMAGWNAIVSLIGGAFSIAAAARRSPA
ncbi:MAG: disulfide bond formation protein B [Caulobacteraceae bacterium]